MKVRVKFAKYGALRYIGHLDVMRFFQKALRRASIDVAYTGGYSPHQIMSFAAPLGIGMVSAGEYMDIEVMDTDDACRQGSSVFQKRLQAVCPEGIEILSVKALPKEAGNAMASVAAAAYAVGYKACGLSFERWAHQAQAFLEQEEILVRKETKRSTVEMNIRPGIYEFRVEDGLLVFTVDASSAGNIRPTFVTDRFFDFIGLHPDPVELQICRLETYTNCGTQQEPRLVALDEVGADF